MTRPQQHNEKKLAEGLADLLGKSLAGGEAVIISGLAPVFGGNARRAWTFDAVKPGAPGSERIPCILLAQVSGGHTDSDTAWEFRVLSAMNGGNVRAPAALALDANGVLTGSPAIILERLPGAAGAVDFLNTEDLGCARSMAEDLARATADLHAFDWSEAGLGNGEPNAPARQIAEWEARYRDRRRGPCPPLTHLFRWLKDNLPAPPRVSLVHGDLRPGNFLFGEGRINALLDWEMAHLGDPAEDIAWIYRELWNPGRFLSIKDFLDAYEARAGISVSRESIRYYRVFSEVKFATLSVAASGLFAEGQTLNLRHIDRAAKVPECLRRAFAWIDGHPWEEYP